MENDLWPIRLGVNSVKASVACSQPDTGGYTRIEGHRNGPEHPGCMHVMLRVTALVGYGCLQPVPIILAITR